MLLQHIILALGLTQLVSASPSRTRDTSLRARSVPSNGLNCYFECPETLGGRALYYAGDTSAYYGAGTYHCYYYSDDKPDLSDAYCTYFQANGELNTAEQYDGEFNKGDCPNPLPLSGYCGLAPQNDRQFKRSLPGRKLSSFEERIKARQWKPFKKPTIAK